MLFVTMALFQKLIDPAKLSVRSQNMGLEAPSEDYLKDINLARRSSKTATNQERKGNFLSYIN